MLISQFAMKCSAIVEHDGASADSQFGHGRQIGAARHEAATGMQVTTLDAPET